MGTPENGAAHSRLNHKRELKSSVSRARRSLVVAAIAAVTLTGVTAFLLGYDGERFGANLAVDAVAGEPKPSSSNAPAKNVTRSLEEDVGDVAEPDAYRLTDFRAPVPATLKGARVVEPEAARTLLQNGKTVFIDVYPRAPKPPNLPKNTVWRDPPHMSIKGAVWLPNVGYGVLAPHVESYFKAQLMRLTDGDKARDLVFFCLKDCWMSWNAAKRALEWGYNSVVWFPDGTDGWQEIGERLVQVKPEKSPGS